MNQGIVGEGVDLDVEHLEDMRPSTISSTSPSTCSTASSAIPGEEPKLHLFGQLKRIARHWLDEGYLVCKGGTYPAQLLYQEIADMAAERIKAAITRDARRREAGQGDPRPLQPEGSTAFVNFTTSQGDCAGRPTPPRMPRQLGGLRQRLGGRVLPRGRGASARARLRQEPEPGLRSALPDGRDAAQIPARLHRAGRRRPAPSRST